MSLTLLDVPNIVMEILMRKAEFDAPVRVVENIYDGALEAPVVVVKGREPKVQSRGKGLNEYKEPIRVACWHDTATEAKALLDDAVTTFSNQTNAIDPKDEADASYGIKTITILGQRREDVYTPKGDRYARIIDLEVLWYHEFT